MRFSDAHCGCSLTNHDIKINPINKHHDSQLSGNLVFLPHANLKHFGSCPKSKIDISRPKNVFP